MNNSYLADITRQALVLEYLLHESRKSPGVGIYDKDATQKIADRTSDAHSQRFEAFMVALEASASVIEVKVTETFNSLSIEDRWYVLHAVSYGLLNKELYNCCGWCGLEWAKRPTEYGQLIFESQLDFFKDVAASENGIRFSNVAEYVRGRSERDIAEEIAKFDEQGYRHHDPLIGRAVDGGIKIHDGNGRLLRDLCSIVLGNLQETATREVWVGVHRDSTPQEEMLYRELMTTVFRKAA